MYGLGWYLQLYTHGQIVSVFLQSQIGTIEIICYCIGACSISTCLEPVQMCQENIVYQY